MAPEEEVKMEAPVASAKGMVEYKGIVHIHLISAADLRNADIGGRACERAREFLAPARSLNSNAQRVSRTRTACSPTRRRRRRRAAR
jgi:hypothetical protein